MNEAQQDVFEEFSMSKFANRSDRDLAFVNTIIRLRNTVALQRSVIESHKLPE